MALDAFGGMRYEAYALHASGRISAYLYRGARGGMIAAAQWDSKAGYYWLGPLGSARNVAPEDEAGVRVADFGAAVQYAKRWE